MMKTTQVAAKDDIINFGNGQPSMSILPVDLMQQSTEHRLAHADPHMLNYGPEPGDDFFRLALAQFLQKRYGVEVQGDQLFVTGGASQGLDFVCTHYTKPNDVVIVDEATYFLSFQIFADHRLTPIAVPCDEQGMRMDALEEAVRQHRPSLLYTIPTFHNPLSVTLPAERRQRMVELSEQYDFHIVADEVYHLLNYSVDVPPPMASYDRSGRVLGLGSFSKILAPGLRLGWIHTKAAAVNKMAEVGYVYSGGSINHFTSKIVQSTLELGLQDNYLDFLHQTYRHRIDLMDQLLREQLPAGIHWDKPDGGFFFWLTFPEGVDTAELKKKGVAYKVGFHSGSQFTNGDNLRNKARLSFAYCEDDGIREGVRRLAQLCHDQL